MLVLCHGACAMSNIQFQAVYNAPTYALATMKATTVYLRPSSVAERPIPLALICRLLVPTLGGRYERAVAVLVGARYSSLARPVASPRSPTGKQNAAPWFQG